MRNLRNYIIASIFGIALIILAYNQIDSSILKWVVIVILILLIFAFIGSGFEDLTFEKKKKLKEQSLDHDETELWSEDINRRLKVAKNLSQEDKKRIVSNISSNVPEKPWPYGMPTSVNPYVCIVGLSPGNSPNLHDLFYTTSLPTIGEAHQGLKYNDTKDYWNRVRKLLYAIIRDKNENLSQEDCLIMSGHLNLDIGREGEGSNVILKEHIVGWVSNLIYEKIKPLVVILNGTYGKLKDYEHYWNVENGININWNEPNEKLSKEFVKSNKIYKFRVWIKLNKFHQKVIVISWPNHFTRPPIKGNFDEAINITRDIIKEAQID